MSETLQPGDIITISVIYTDLQREHAMREAEQSGGLTEAELEAFDKPAREVFREALAATPDGEAFMRYYREHAAEVSDIGKEERNETQR